MNLGNVAARVEYFPISAKTGEGTAAWSSTFERPCPNSPFLFDEDEVSDVPEAMWVAELVREQLVRKTSRNCRTRFTRASSNSSGRHIIVEILVERESQKGDGDRQGWRTTQGRRHRRAPSTPRGVLPRAQGLRRARLAEA